MRCHAGGRTGQLITTARGPKVTGAASRVIYLVEVGLYNNADTEVSMTLQRCSAVGTGGGAITEICADDDSYTPVGTAIGVPTADDTVVAGEYARAMLGAAKGAGTIWTFGKNGLKVPAGTANGIGIYLVSGTTAQNFDFYFIWDE